MTHEELKAKALANPDVRREYDALASEFESRRRKMKFTSSVQIATTDDLPAWLLLAAEVEPLFGPLVQEASFLRALTNNIQRGSAYCIRENDGAPGSPLLGGLLFSPTPPNYRIGWLAVVERTRKRGHGARLLRFALDQVTPPATISVVTFGPDNLAGLPARQLYMSFGFVPAEMTEPGPEGGSRQIFRLQLDA